ncbi:hypothetical protein D3C85_1386730 [compost metagenome]
MITATAEHDQRRRRNARAPAQLVDFRDDLLTRPVLGFGLVRIKIQEAQAHAREVDDASVRLGILALADPHVQLALAGFDEVQVSG